MTAEPTTPHSKGKQPLDAVLAYALDAPNLVHLAKEKVVRYIQGQASLSNDVDEIDRVLDVSIQFILYGSQVFIRNLAKEVYESWARVHQERVVEHVLLSGRLKELLNVTGEGGAQLSGSDSMIDAAVPSERSNTEFNDNTSVVDVPAGKNEPQSNGQVMEGQTFVLITASFTALSGFARETLMRLIADVYDMLPEYITLHRGNILELASIGVFLTSTGTLAWQNPSVHIWPVLGSVVCSLAATKHSSLVTCKNQPAILVVLKKLFRLCWEVEAQADKLGEDILGHRLCDKVIALILKLAAERASMEMPSVLLVSVIDTIPVSKRLSLAISQTLCDLSDAEVTKLLLCLDFWCDNWKIPSNTVAWLLEVFEVLIESGRTICLSRTPIIALIAKYIRKPSTEVRASNICDTLIRLEAHRLFHRTSSEAEVCHSDDSLSSMMTASGTSDSSCATRFGIESTGEFVPLSRSYQRLGLVNPRFYCYMNSILQMLFAATRFRYDVLHASNLKASDVGASAGQPVLRQLQQVFGFMEFSVRPFYDPSDFRQAALPVQFNAMQQHDCSEFLGHLLDELHEQERAYRRLLPPQRPTASSTSNCTAFPQAISQPSGDAHECNREGRNCCPSQLGISPGSSGHSGAGEIITDAVAPFADMETGPPLDLSADIGLPHDDLMKVPIASPVEPPVGVTGQCPTTTIEAAEVNREDPTISWRHFGGCQLVTTRCLSCGTVSRKREPFLHIPVHVPREDQITAESTTVGLLDRSTLLPPSVAELIERAVGNERLEQDNQLLCDRCGCNRDAVRSAPVCAAPQYLIVTLCRFDFDRNTGARTKTSTPVRCDERLALPVMPVTAKEPLARCHSGEAGSTVDDVGEGAAAALLCGATAAAAAEYRLLAAVSHLGENLSGGHYVCHARHAVSPNEESVNEAEQQRVGQQQWFLFDDSKVSRSSFNSIPGNALLTRSKALDAATAYVLLYERIFSEAVSPIIDSDGHAVPAVSTSTASSAPAAAGVSASGSRLLSAGHLPSSLATLLWYDNITYAQAVSKLVHPRTTSAIGNPGCRPFTRWPPEDNEDDDDDSFIRQAGVRLDDSTLTGSRFIH